MESTATLLGGQAHPDLAERIVAARQWLDENRPPRADRVKEGTEGFWAGLPQWPVHAQLDVAAAWYRLGTTDQERVEAMLLRRAERAHEMAERERAWSERQRQGTTPRPRSNPFTKRRRAEAQAD